MPGARDKLFARILVCGVALATIGWGLYVIPSLWLPTSLERVARHIIQGDSFQDGAITALTSTLDNMQDDVYPGAIKSVAVIRLRALENAMADGDTRTLDQGLRRLHASIRTSLSKAPADPFLWLVLFWLENTQNGFSGSHLKYLQMSYSLGPNEGWVAVKRNRLALAVFPQLTPQLRHETINEFAGLVHSGFVAQATDLLVGPGWPIRQRLLSALQGVPRIQKEQLAQSVYRLGYDVSVPGVKQQPLRPWR